MEHSYLVPDFSLCEKRGKHQFGQGASQIRARIDTSSKGRWGQRRGQPNEMRRGRLLTFIEGSLLERRAAQVMPCWYVLVEGDVDAPYIGENDFGARRVERRAKLIQKRKRFEMSRF